MNQYEEFAKGKTFTKNQKDCLKYFQDNQKEPHFYEKDQTFTFFINAIEGKDCLPCHLFCSFDVKDYARIRSYTFAGLMQKCFVSWELNLFSRKTPPCTNLDHEHQKFCKTDPQEIQHMLTNSK